MDHEVEGARHKGRSKKTWSEVVKKIVRSDNYTKRML